MNETYSKEDRARDLDYVEDLKTEVGDQLRDLSVIANRLGMYDAADHLRRKIER